MIDGTLAILAAFAVVTFAPGPANLAVGLTALAHGWAHALPMALGLAVGLAAWGVVAAAGLGAVLVASETALFVLRVVGGLYLLWLAWQSARVALRSDTHEMPTAGGFVRGLLLNLSNPKAVLAWIAALSMGLTPEAGAGAVLSVTFLCALIGLANYLFWAAAFSRAGARSAYARFRRWIEGGAAFLLGAAGIGLMRQGLSR
ncbi:LysE family translocator [Jannaschia aquimarina]|uniref:RhtC_2 protein n=1 Tax=Jannaschia aquimarina TaxID=935700 RepID=A0A0D1D9D5_9RHOB|nr:LysE family translocator [Jannaschia aquimarina]KIT16508.1 Threonine efflux protein [Jannaschia aquimarina]SNT06882.1 Threonine/homoserine/homoserine lactone efflux protein [Jannaschia aquimarina]